MLLEIEALNYEGGDKKKENVNYVGVPTWFFNTLFLFMATINETTYLKSAE